MIYKNYIHKLEDLSSIDPRHLVFRQETVAWLTPAVPPDEFCFGHVAAKHHQGMWPIAKGTPRGEQESMVLCFCFILSGFSLGLISYRYIFSGEGVYHTNQQILHSCSARWNWWR